MIFSSCMFYNYNAYFIHELGFNGNVMLEMCGFLKLHIDNYALLDILYDFERKITGHNFRFSKF